MKALNISSVKRAKQAGFTIIELIVVILLLGILTATALPRFLDISDDAHGAVVDAVEGSLRTGLALYRAGWIAGGQDTGSALTTFGAGNLFPDEGTGANGYPVGADDGLIEADAVDCLAVFDGLLDLGGLTTVGIVAPDIDAASESVLEAAAATVDWVIAPDDATTATGCIFYYTGQFKEGGDGTPGNLATRTIRTITYAIPAGTITRGTHLLDQN